MILEMNSFSIQFIQDYGDYEDEDDDGEYFGEEGYDQDDMMVGHEDEDGVVHAGNVDGSYDVNEAEEV